MAKIKLQDLITVLNRDVVKYNSCIEMNFCIDNDTEYEDCWLGKMPDRDERSKEIYWYGLVPDGSQAYDLNIMHANYILKKMIWILLLKNWIFLRI